MNRRELLMTAIAAPMAAAAGLTVLPSEPVACCCWIWDDDNAVWLIPGRRWAVTLVNGMVDESRSCLGLPDEPPAA